MAGKLVKKMSIKDIGCDPTVARQEVNKDKVIDLATVWGRASGTKSGENRQTGNVWTALTGRFEATNLQTTDEALRHWESGMLFIPGGAQELIEGTVETGQRSGDGFTVEFALKISAIYDKSSPVGYRYTITNLMPPREADELSEMRRIVQAATANLIPGPVPAMTPTPYMPPVAQLESAAPTPDPEPGQTPSPAPVPSPAPAPSPTRQPQRQPASVAPRSASRR